MKIFISIASYRDPLLLETLCSAYTNARNKDDLVFGVCEQTDNGINVEALEFKHQVKYELLDPVIAKGPCWARARIQSFFANEDYFLQVDSHTIFIKDWDHILIQHHAWLENNLDNSFVITGYPRAFKPNNDLTSFQLDTSSKVTWGVTLEEERIFEDGHYSFQRAFPSQANVPIKGLLIAAGFIFSKGQFVKDLPYDQKFYFHGEELSLALRLFTNNWDVIYIPETPLFHFYTDVTKLPRKLHWNEEDESNRVIKWTELDRKSKLRLSDLISNKLDSPFGLGSQRTVEKFAAQMGIDFLNKKVLDIDLATKSLAFTEIDSNKTPFHKIKLDS